MGREDQSWNGHRRAVLATDLCGCFHCLSTFPPSSIVEWVDVEEAGVGQTALCPYCGIDKVVAVRAEPSCYVGASAATAA